MWHDTTASAIARVNDLNLTAERYTAFPQTPEWYVGNNGLTGPDATNWSPMENYVPPSERDAVNTVENIFIQYPNPGTWKIGVWGFEVNEDCEPQTPTWEVPYALVVSIDFDCNGDGIPDSEEDIPRSYLDCREGGGPGGGGGQPDPEVPGGGGPGTGAQ